ncbi:hypothetical protein KKA93_01115 [Patescibacteria group bacterium]|nr:hypothetical protein [Patescibacteria group bacterium]MBU1663252.1 hypothetical protein [Patescibacteria group bacterium]MBU1934026.1 hypothetical protein [Patescibacteria group bacterium]MBU2007966.1 hypothetical protein [Patescibacteria group bacterium]MBU2264275.1 hypothetical protein [Patescibacteria group bacterium]
MNTHPLKRNFANFSEYKKIITLADYAKENKLSHSNLINKANRQTIEAFLEKNIWKIGV